MPTTDPRAKKALLIKLALVAVVVLIAGAFLLRGGHPKEWLEQGLALIRSAGPVTFFVAMALLPGFGVPVTTFSLSAGSLFGEQLGMTNVVLLSLAAVTVNLILTYWLARSALRPLLSKLVTRLGYKLPEVSSADAGDLILILRVTPGFPFFVQNYLLGLADAPVRPYLVLSCAIVWAYQTAFVLFGDALLHGKGKIALMALGGLVALAALTHLIRKHYAKKQRASATAA